MGPPVVVAQFRAETGQLLPVAFTTNCDEVGEEDDVVAQPMAMLNPMKLTTKRSSTCKGRRFRKPMKPSKAATIVPANEGLGLRRSSAVLAGAVIVSVVVEVARAKVVTVVGLKEQGVLIGKKPEQLKAMEPLKAAFAVIVRVTAPLPPAGMVRVDFDDVMVKAGGGKVMTYAAEATVLLL